MGLRRPPDAPTKRACLLNWRPLTDTIGSGMYDRVAIGCLLLISFLFLFWIINSVYYCVTKYPPIRKPPYPAPAARM